MPPKRAAAQKAVVTSPLASESNDNDLEKAGSDAVDSVPAVKVAAYPAALVMVKEAVKALDSRKGVSSQAIRNSIKLKYPTMDLVRLKYIVRKALIKGLENGALVRPANSTAAATGATGRFRLAPQKDTEPKRKTENTDPNVEKPKAGPKKANAADKESGIGKKNDAKKKGASTGTVKKTKDVTASKVAPAKKPKAKRAAVDMEASEDADGEPKAKEPKAKEPKAKEPKAKEPKAKEPKAKEPKAKEPKAKEPKAMEVEKEPKTKVPKATKEKAAVEAKPVAAKAAAGRRVKNIPE